ncbi:V-type ATPase subunit [Candidatus Magnetaquicoccus inordinatus]|uniref:V-type ATPase subunit n=1 Tax=Candidatus Magnetaquicoccus inordinatus TaxID=2496818 RepID=UPI00102C89AE|nr:V-type ATPase subunit [Candidatus Magnetaquicoccus inordinatus]
MTPAFAYLQARLQAHHGQRLDEHGWRRLEMVMPFRLFLKNARETSLAPWLQTISENDEPSLLEQRLRETLHHELQDLCHWSPPQWQAAIRWTSHLWLLPAWQQRWRGQPLPPGVTLPDDPAMNALHSSWKNGTPLEEGWLWHWQGLWPQRNKQESRALHNLLRLLQQHRLLFAALPDAHAARQARLQLQQQLREQFRRAAGQPAAIFIYLALAALDWERLRGNLLLRALFHASAPEPH